jgi:phosphocarrier protein HPr
MAMDDVLIQREVQIVNPLGLHARPAALFVKLANTFGADVEVGNDSMMVNGKSIMGVMMLAAECGSTILIKASGDDAAQAVDALAQLVGKGFGES